MPDEMTLLRDARPPADGPHPLLAERAREELMTEIASSSGQRRRSRRVLPIAVPALALVVAAVVGVALAGRGGGTAWAAELVEVAQGAPRVLVGEDRWRVTRADEFSADYGEMTFSNSGRELELHWQPAQQYQSFVRDRARSSDVQTRASVTGADARVFRYTGVNDFTAIWVRDGSVLEARARASDVDAFKALLASLRSVDVDTWLSALPASVIAPAGRAEVVDEMLVGVPLPPGFAAAPLLEGNAVRDRYQLGAQVAGAVACAWIDRWVDARRTGKTGLEREAVAALETARSWQVLREMNDEGDYPEVLWQYVDAIAAGTPVLGGRAFSVEESYRGALGCRAP
jgi:hypothetical protein